MPRLGGSSYKPFGTFVNVYLVIKFWTFLDHKNLKVHKLQNLKFFENYKKFPDTIIIIFLIVIFGHFDIWISVSKNDVLKNLS